MADIVPFPEGGRRKEGYGGYDDLPNRIVDLAEAFPMSRLTDAQLDAYRQEYAYALYEKNDDVLYARLRELLAHIDQLLDEQAPAEGLPASVEVTYIIHTLLSRALDAHINLSS